MAKAKAALFMIEGFEETEAVCSADILRRAEIDLVTVSLGQGKRLVGRSGIAVETDAMFADIAGGDFDALVIPGGTLAYAEHEELLELIREHDKKGRLLAAICAAPAALGKAGVLKGRRAVIYPGMEKWLEGAEVCNEIVVADGNIITSKGPGTAVYFALRIVEELMGRETAVKVADKFIAQKLIA